MAVVCPKCGQQFDVTLFAFNQKVRCDCGHLFGLAESGRLNLKEHIHLREAREEQRRYQKLQRMCDGICMLMASGRLPHKLINPLINRAKSYCEEFFPGKGWLFDMIYVTRFERIKKRYEDNPE